MAYATNATISDESDAQWRIPVAFQLIPSVVLLLGTFLIPESPHFLAATADIEEVEKSVAWLSNRSADDLIVAREASEIRDNVLASLRKQQQRKTNFLKEAFTRPVLKRLSVGVGLMVAQNMIGLNALNYYTATICYTAGFRSVSTSLFLVGIFGLDKLIASMAFTFVFVKMKGNRFWLLLGSSVCTVSMFILGYCVETMPESSGPVDEDGAFTVRGALAVLMVYIFSFFFGISLGPISWNVCAEIFPTHINDKCCTITTCAQWFWNIVIAAITPFLLAAIAGKTFILYGGFGVLTLLFCYFFVPETRGVPLGRAMDAVFGDDLKIDDDTAAVEEVEDVDEEAPLLTKSMLTERDKRRRRSSLAVMI